MSSRLGNVATVNEQIAADGHYLAADGTPVSVAAALGEATAGTRCHRPEDRLPTPPSPAGATTGPRIEVTAEGSLQAARRLCENGPDAPEGAVAVLNFASARNPGGGYLGGAKAQEEDLCRQALLYSCLLNAPEYYRAHRESADLLYSDRVIWSPQVPVIRGDNGALLAKPYRASFLTCPAPNAGEALRRDPAEGERIRETLNRRAARVLAVAAAHGARRLVLGAWGCGVFRNDPAEVAEAFQAALAAHPSFDEVVFAVWDRSAPSANRAAFEQVFGGVRAG